MWVLLAEDNDALAANIAEYLEQAGDVIDFARDGEGSLHQPRDRGGRFGLRHRYARGAARCA